MATQLGRALRLKATGSATGRALTRSSETSGTFTNARTLSERASMTETLPS